jgi:outer membrane protein assembly factor BamB
MSDWDRRYYNGVGRSWTTRCCSASARITLLATAAAVITAWTPRLGAQSNRQADPSAPLSLFPVRTVWTLALNNQLVAPPVYSGRHAYFAIEGDRLVAYELEAGRQLWLTMARPEFEPAVGDGLLFIAGPASLTALREKDGTVAWEQSEIGPLAVPPVWDNGWLVVATRKGDVLAFRAVDGHLVWQRALGSPAHAAPALAADRVYVPLDDNRVVAMRVDSGDQVWERRLGGPATGLIALEDRIFGGSTDNFFYALSATDGQVAWRWRTGADLVGVPVVDERNVYFVSLDNVLRALSRRTGVQQWVRLLPLRPSRGPLKLDRLIVVSGVAPMLRAFNIKDGFPAGELPAAGELAGAPYAVPGGPLPEALVVTRDLAKGATATLFRRQLEPPLTPFSPPPGAMKGALMPDARPE